MSMVSRGFHQTFYYLNLFLVPNAHNRTVYLEPYWHFDSKKLNLTFQKALNFF